MILYKSCLFKSKCSQIESLTSMPKDFRVASVRSFTMGLHPPQPVPALVQLTTSARSLDSPLSIVPQICPFVTFSQEHICASSGKSITSPKEPPPSLAGKIN